MRFGLDIAQQRLEFEDVVKRAQFAEELEFEGAWGFDHFEPMYGEGPGNCFEGMTTLAALAGRTDRIRLGLLVASVTWRHPSVFAVEAVTIDHASGGRFDLALGAGWHEPEHTQLGVDFPDVSERFDRLEDTLEVINRLFTGEVVDYQGRTVELQAAQVRPLPVQQPRPPIWIGGSGRRRTLPLVARYADVWHTAGAENVAELSTELDRLAEECGRDPSSIKRAGFLGLSQSMDDIRRELEQRQVEGYDYLVCGWPGEGEARIEKFAETLMRDVDR